MHREASNAWYLLPVLFALLGGIMSYIAVREYDQQKGINCIALGIFITIVDVILFRYLTLMPQ